MKIFLGIFVSNKKPTVIDLFAGAGGFSLAAKQAGFEVKAAIELDADACETYSLNINKNVRKKAKVFDKDILTEIDPEDVLKELGINSGELDLLLGGPPCQGFSSHRINDAGVDDPRNKLLLRYFEYVKVIRPKVFLVENVTGLLWKKHAEYLEKFKNLATENEYEIYGPVVLDSSDYGVPQKRKRVFILGVDERIGLPKIDWPPCKTHGPGTKKERLTSSSVFERPPQKTLVKLQKILGKEVVENLEYGSAVNKDDPCNIHMQHKSELAMWFSRTPLNGGRLDSGRVLDCHKNHTGHKDVYGRIKLSEPSNTMTTGCYNPSKGRFVHPWLDHGITIRHAARLQTFPDDFVFKGSSTNQSKQVGNAVPPVLGAILIKMIKNNLLN